MSSTIKLFKMSDLVGHRTDLDPSAPAVSHIFLRRSLLATEKLQGPVALFEYLAGLTTRPTTTSTRAPQDRRSHIFFPK